MDTKKFDFSFEFVEKWVNISEVKLRIKDITGFIWQLKERLKLAFGVVVECILYTYLYIIYIIYIIHILIQS